MAFKIAALAVLVYCSVAQSQGDDNSLPLIYNETTEIQGDGATCPNDQLRQETQLDIANNIDTLLYDVIPLLDLPTPTSPPECACMSEGRRIAYLDMTDPSQRCPQPWQLIESPKRTCGRLNSTGAGCQSVLYPTNGNYTRVCGRIIAYHFCYAEGLVSYNRFLTPIDGVYADGVSITHGSPRQHVWTFVTAHGEFYTGLATCPCINTNNNANVLTPPYVGDDYFCDTGAAGQTLGICGQVPTNSFRDDDPLWDGAGCGPTNTCCEFNNPPWFCTTLPVSVTDYIEVRICSGSRSLTGGDSPIEQIELYVS